MKDFLKYLAIFLIVFLLLNYSCEKKLSENFSKTNQKKKLINKICKCDVKFPVTSPQELKDCIAMNNMFTFQQVKTNLKNLKKEGRINCKKNKGKNKGNNKGKCISKKEAARRTKLFYCLSMKDDCEMAKKYKSFAGKEYKGKKNFFNRKICGINANKCKINKKRKVPKYLGTC